MPPPPLPMTTPDPDSPMIRPVIGIPQVVAVERRHVGDRHRRHRRGDAAAEIGGVESGDGARAAAAAAHVIPEPFAADAERRDGADAGNDDAGSGRTAHVATYIRYV